MSLHSHIIPPYNPNTDSDSPYNSNTNYYTIPAYNPNTDSNSSCNPNSSSHTWWLAWCPFICSPSFGDVVGTVTVYALLIPAVGESWQFEVWEQNTPDQPNVGLCSVEKLRGHFAGLNCLAWFRIVSWPKLTEQPMCGTTCGD